MPTLILEFDDLHFLSPENCLPSIRYLVSKYPSIKLSFFTVPCLRGVPLYEDETFCKEIKSYIESGNVKIGVHGLLHTSEEFKHVTYSEAVRKLSMAEDILKMADIPYEKIFRGPHWGLNTNSLKALIDMDYKTVYNHLDYKHLEVPRIKFKYYNWNLKDNYLASNEDIIAHGHTHDVCGNGIGSCTIKISRFIEEHKPVFQFIGHE